MIHGINPAIISEVRIRKGRRSWGWKGEKPQHGLYWRLLKKKAHPLVYLFRRTFFYIRPYWAPPHIDVYGANGGYLKTIIARSNADALRIYDEIIAAVDATNAGCKFK